MTREIRNARITSTMLGIEDHGIFTAVVQLEGNGWSQGFGTYCYGAALKASPAQAMSALRFIQEVCRIAGVDSWEKLPGKYVRMEFDNCKVYRIGSILGDDWFDTEERIAS